MSSNPSYKPAEYNSVSPYLIVSSAAKTIEFMVAVLGAKELRRFADDSGRIMHAEVRVDDTVVMVADCTPDWPALPTHVHVYVPDVDATYQAALRWGAESIMAPMKKQDADKRGGVKDHGGTSWWLATKVE